MLYLEYSLSINNHEIYHPLNHQYSSELIGKICRLWNWSYSSSWSSSIFFSSYKVVGGSPTLFFTLRALHFNSLILIHFIVVYLGMNEYIYAGTDQLTKPIAMEEEKQEISPVVFSDLHCIYHNDNGVDLWCCPVHYPHAVCFPTKADCDNSDQCDK